jgi:hypothetical protein
MLEIKRGDDLTNHGKAQVNEWLGKHQAFYNLTHGRREISWSEAEFLAVYRIVYLYERNIRLELETLKAIAGEKIVYRENGEEKTEVRTPEKFITEGWWKLIGD